MNLQNANKNNTYRVAAVTVTYGSRLPLLMQTVEAIMREDHVIRLIIVDNASENEDLIRQNTLGYGDRIRIIRHEKNLGSAGGFSAGIDAARKEDVDYIYLSDDDVVVSNEFVEPFRIAHTVIGNDQVVLCARRKSFWAGTDVHYVPDIGVRPRQYFNIFNPGIIVVFVKALLRINEQHVRHEPARFFPIVPSLGWAYAGVLLPIMAATQAPLPDSSLGLYLDDIVYSWGVIDAGYPTFALMEPHLVDIEMTHAGAHTATGLFSPAVSSTKIYYETRNRVRVSLKYGGASTVWLRIRVVVWCVGVCLLGILRHGIHMHTISRMRLITEALRAGFNVKRMIPNEVLVKV